MPRAASDEVGEPRSRTGVRWGHARDELLVVAAL